MPDDVVVSVEHLRKVYGRTIAVDDVSFSVRRGEILGIVGPNGAGKTTTVECLEGLRQPDAGLVRVLGLDPTTDGYALRNRIGVQLQQSELQDRIRVWEALDLYSAFYEHALPWAPLLERLGLGDKRDATFSKLSGGQQQRLFIALALVSDPEVVFLDELTTGLDPQARHSIWDLIRDVREQGKTVVLTTHFMEEAERLCDRVAIMDAGRLVALDTPEALMHDHVGDQRVLFRAAADTALPVLRRLPRVSRVEQDGETIVVYGRDEDLVVDVVNALSGGGIAFRALRTEQPALEDVFLALTGRQMRE